MERHRTPLGKILGWNSLGENVTFGGLIKKNDKIRLSDNSNTNFEG